MTTQNNNFSIIRDSIVNNKMVSVIVAENLTKELATIFYNKIVRFNSTTQRYSIFSSSIVTTNYESTQDSLDSYFEEKELNDNTQDFDYGNLN